MRFPSVSRVHFIECGANTGMEWAQRRGADGPVLARDDRLQRVDRRAAVDAARARPASTRKAKFVLAEGADGAALTRTIPLDDGARRRAWSCYGQNGEMLRPEQGYPLRLLVPGVQGVSSVKWLRRIEARRRAVEHARGVAALRRPDARRQAPPVHVDPGGEERDHVAVGRPGDARPGLPRDHGPRVVGARQGAARRRVDRRRAQLAHGARCRSRCTPRR